MPLVRSSKSLPSTHSTVVLILLNELVQLNTDVCTTYFYKTAVRLYSIDNFPSEVGMMVAVIVMANNAIQKSEFPIVNDIGEPRKAVPARGG